jgi:N-acetylneuraminate synthase
MSIKKIVIAGREISQDVPPYVIAELSANHNGSLDSALRLIKIAKQSGASAVKIQTYRPDTITLDSDRDDFYIDSGKWAGQTLFDLYKSAHTPWDWHPRLFQYAAELGITIFSSPFDLSAIDFLEELGAPAYKIASFEAVDLKLIKYAASTGKPLIISTGMADAEEIGEAVAAARDAGCRELAVLHCVSAYPAPASDYSLRTIPDMIRRYDLPTGISDHTLDNTTAVVAVALGACIVEKHFTLDRTGGGPDDDFSLEPDGLKQLCASAQTAWQALGRVDYGRKSSEIGNVKFRRSLYFVKDLKAGDLIAADAVRSVRPGFGLAPKYLDQIIGAKLAKDVRFGDAVTWDHCLKL